MISRSRILNGTVDASAVSRSGLMQAGTVTDDATSGTVVVFPVAFDSTPKIVATPASAGTFAISITNQSSGSFTLTTSAAGTVDWIAVIAPTG